MRQLIWYIRSMFCAHDFKTHESNVTLKDQSGNVLRKGPKISMTCTKCGFHRCYWKYLD
jgi:hypothetical protein